jgi:hypothetical protein
MRKSEIFGTLIGDTIKILNTPRTGNTALRELMADVNSVAIHSNPAPGNVTT